MFGSLTFFDLLVFPTFSAAGLLAFDGLFIFFWSIVLIILTLLIKDHHSGFMKWLVGPLGLTIQLAIL